MLPPTHHRVRAVLRHLTAALVAALGLSQGLAHGQDVTEPALKAAFIYNFAKFTTWPTDLQVTDSFSICVLGDPAVSAALERAVSGRKLFDRPIAVTRVAAVDSKRGCRILYVSGLPVREAAGVVGELRDTPVLTISNIEGFASSGGITQFFFEHGQLRFRIHLESAKRVGLQISSRLLIMAKPQ